MSMRSYFLRVAAAASCLISVAAGVAPAAARCQWTIVPSPNQSSLTNILTSFGATSTTDGWAVGYYFSETAMRRVRGNTLTEHWSGSQWSVVPSPNPWFDSYLNSIAVLSTKNAWAVGEFDTSAHGVAQTLIEHWNGSRWSIVPSPNVGSNPSYLQAVSARSATDIWAVGSYGAAFTTNTLIEHWNGASWSIVPSPNGGPSANMLYGVKSSTSGAWAVGSYSDGTVTHTLAEQWNGSSWNVVPTPDPGPLGGYFQAVGGNGPTDVWAVGNAVGNPYQVLAEHWDGSTWSIVPIPNPVGTGSFADSVSVHSTTDAWTVGYYSGTDNVPHTLTEHWNGAIWSIVKSPDGGTDGANLLGVGQVPGSRQVWTVGGFSLPPFGDEETLIETHC